MEVDVVANFSRRREMLQDECAVACCNGTRPRGLNKQMPNVRPRHSRDKHAQRKDPTVDDASCPVFRFTCFCALPKHRRYRPLLCDAPCSLRGNDFDESYHQDDFRKGKKRAVCKTTALWALLKGFGPLFYILLGLRYPSSHHAANKGSKLQANPDTSLDLR